MPRICPAAHGTNPHWQWVSRVQARLPQVWGELEQWGDHNKKMATNDIFFFKLYNDKSLQVHFQRHLDSNECVLGNELPYVCETCGKGFFDFAFIVLVVSCFLCFSFLTKNTPGWFNLTNYTRHVESRECKVCFQSNPFCRTSDLIVPVSIIPDFRCFQSNIFCCTSDLIVPNWIVSDFR